MSHPERRVQGELAGLRAELEELRADRDKWKALAQKHEQRSKGNKLALDYASAELTMLRAELGRTARRLALFTGAARVNGL